MANPLVTNEKSFEEVEVELSAERAAQVNSVLRIIKDAMQKLQISLLLPRIFENPITVRSCLADTEYEQLINLITDYFKEKKTIKGGRNLDFSIMKIIDIFQENHQMVEKLPDWLDELKSQDKDLIAAFSLLENITETRLHKSAMSELIKEKKIHQIYNENEQMKKNIADFQSKIRNQRINLRWKLAAKDGVIKKYEEDLAYKKWENSVKIKQEITKSSRRIRTIHNTSITKQKELEEELEKTKMNYEKVMSTNLHVEKEAQAEKKKLLIQLQSLIKKFDQTIGDKIKENIHLQESYEAQKRDFDIFMVEFQSIEQEYDTVVYQKELEEKRKREMEIMLFMMNHAAKTIQRWWRKLMKAYKKVKTKKGKGKGKGKK